MTGFISFLLSFLLLYKYWALFAVMLVAGLIFPLPTSTVLLAVGAFSGQGYFNFPVSLAIAAGANTLGDTLMYALARTYGRRLLGMLHRRTPAYLERLERYVERHPRSTIFITRFIGTADPLTNLFAGFIGVPFTTFIAYDILGNVASNGLVLCAGYVLGIDWQNFSAILTTADWILFVIVIAAAILISRRYKNRDKK
ncbi:MAG: DedA family protein [Minisyncoccia bacterium]